MLQIPHDFANSAPGFSAFVSFGTIYILTICKDKRSLLLYWKYFWATKTKNIKNTFNLNETAISTPAGYLKLRKKKFKKNASLWMLHFIRFWELKNS